MSEGEKAKQGSVLIEHENAKSQWREAIAMYINEAHQGELKTGDEGLVGSVPKKGMVRYMASFGGKLFILARSSGI